jgi:hypothetical protein
MKEMIELRDVIEGANHQINVSFITKQGETHLAMIIPMNLQNDEYAQKRFNEVVKSVPSDENGQYYFELISNMDEPGTILDQTKTFSVNDYAEIVNSIITKAHYHVTKVFNW